MNIQRMPRTPNDRFVTVMEVSMTAVVQVLYLQIVKPFVKQVKESVEALSNMATALDAQLNSLLLFFGETPDSPDAPKPEEFFGSILTFSTSLQVSEATDVESSTNTGCRKPPWRCMMRSLLKSTRRRRWSYHLLHPPGNQ